MKTLIMIVSGFAILICLLFAVSATRTLAGQILKSMGEPAANMLIWLCKSLMKAHSDLMASLLQPKTQLFDSLKEKLLEEERQARHRNRKKSI